MGEAVIACDSDLHAGSSMRKLKAPTDAPPAQQHRRVERRRISSDIRELKTNECIKVRTRMLQSWKSRGWEAHRHLRDESVTYGLGPGNLPRHRPVKAQGSPDTSRKQPFAACEDRAAGLGTQEWTRSSAPLARTWLLKGARMLQTLLSKTEQADHGEGIDGSMSA